MKLLSHMRIDAGFPFKECWLWILLKAFVTATTWLLKYKMGLVRVNVCLFKALFKDALIESLFIMC